MELYKKKYCNLLALTMAVFCFGGCTQEEQAISFIVGVLISDNYTYLTKKVDEKYKMKY